MGRSYTTFPILFALLAACNSKERAGVDCITAPESPQCGPTPVASATLTIVKSPRVVGDTAVGFATASTTRGTALAVPTYNGANLTAPANPALFEHLPAVGSAIYGARAVQTGAIAQNATDQTLNIASIDASSTVDKTSIPLGDSVRVTVPPQPGRDSVVVLVGGARRASVLEGGGGVSILPTARGITNITTTGFNGRLTQAGSIHTVTVQ